MVSLDRGCAIQVLKVVVECFVLLRAPCCIFVDKYDFCHYAMAVSVCLPICCKKYNTVSL